ncbi:MAG: protein-disulfide reductase DsbD domain-containing protein [Pseudomonadota bacterium]
MVRFLSLFFLALSACAVWADAHAQTVIETDLVRTEILPEKTGVAPGGALWFAVQQTIEPDWHVFWINPGAAGLPLELAWSLPEGFETGDILFPVPKKIPVGPLASFAYEGAPVFLTELRAPADAVIGDVITTTIKASWQVCADVCIPQDGEFSFDIEIVAELAPILKNEILFSTARTAIPPAHDKIGRLSASDGELFLSLPGLAGLIDTDPFFFPSIQGTTDPAAPQSAETDGDVLRLRMKPGGTIPDIENQVSGILGYTDRLGRRSGIIVAADVDQSIEDGLALQAVNSVSSSPRQAIPLSALLVFAFLGGVLLNIMPCVFPIIFVKAASLMSAGSADHGRTRMHGAVYSLGVIGSFLALGGLLLALRAGGEQLGWGFHLQSPVVVALSAYVLFLVGLNLAGVFDIGESLQGVGGAAADTPGLAGSFFTGVLAVAVAAPCIGPFLSAPMGAALLLPGSYGLLIFALMGAGLAAPYLLLSLAPVLGRILPKPGPWMVWFKQVLAFPVFAAAAYFVWILSRQSASIGFALVLGGLVLLALAAWLFQRSKSPGVGAIALRAVSAAVALAAVAPLFRLEPATATVSNVVSYGAMDAIPYDKAELARLRAGGQSVFLDFTAAWCVTCQFDRLTIFSDDAVARAFQANEVQFMVADWTVRDPAITAALEEFGASGVPFYVLYRGDAEPIVFSIPLTKSVVLDAVSG